MKTVVIFKSKTGFTKKYADWIAKELSADIYKLSKVDVNKLLNYDVVIYGGSLHAVGINGIKFIKKNIHMFKDKKLIVFATGLSPSKKEIIDEVRNKNLTTEEQKYIRFFYLRGGFNFSKLGTIDKILMMLLKRRIERKKELTDDEKLMLSIYKNPVDFTSKEGIAELVSYVNS